MPVQLIRQILSTIKPLILHLHKDDQPALLSLGINTLPRRRRPKTTPTTGSLSTYHRAINSAVKVEVKNVITDYQHYK